MEISELKLEVEKFLEAKRPRDAWPVDLKSKIMSFHSSHYSDLPLYRFAGVIGINSYLLYIWHKRDRPPVAHTPSFSSPQIFEVKKETSLSLSLRWGKLRIDFGGCDAS